MVHAESTYPRRATATMTGGAAEIAAGARQRGLAYLLLTLGLAVMVAPFLWMVFGSIKSPDELLRTPPT